MSSEARPRRRWFQFSLRWLMISTLVAASFFAGLTYQREVNRRLREEVERAKVTLERAEQEAEVANMMARYNELICEGQRQETAMAKFEAAQVIFELHHELLNAMQLENLTEHYAALRRLDKLMEKERELLANDDVNLPAPSPTRAYQEPPAFLPQSARDFWESFRPGGNLPAGNEKAPINKPKASPELQFDQPLIDQTIG